MTDHSRCTRGPGPTQGPTPLPFVPDVHLACWQGNFHKLKALLRANNCVLTSVDIEFRMHLPYGVPNCLRMEGAECPYASDSLELEEACPALHNAPEKTQSLPSALEVTSCRVDAKASGLVCLSNSKIGREREALSPSISLSSPEGKPGRVVPYWKKSKVPLSAAGQEIDALFRVHNQCPKVWGNPAQLALASGSFRCANLVLAILLIRKLLSTGIVTADDPLVTDVWSRGPKVSIFNAVDKVTKDLELIAPVTRDYLRLSKNRDEAKCTVIAACLLGQRALLRAIRFREDLDGSVFREAPIPLIVLSMIGGDKVSVREVLEWMMPIMSGEQVAAACCQTLEVARLCEDSELASMVSSVGEFFPLRFHIPVAAFLAGMYGVLSHFIWVKQKREAVEESLRKTWDAEKTAMVITQYAPFFLDPSDLLIRRRSNIDYVDVKYLRALIDRREWDVLPRRLSERFRRIFAHFCQKERVSWLLLQMENEQMLRAIPHKTLGRLTATVLQHISVAEDKYPLKTKCSLCSRPVLSFILWMSDKPGVFSTAEEDEFSWYCNSPDLVYCAKRLVRSQKCPLCNYHCVEFLRKYHTIPKVLEAVKERRGRTPLSVHAVLSVLKSLKGESEKLRELDLPEELQNFFCLELRNDVERMDEMVEGGNCSQVSELLITKVRDGR